MQGLHYTLQASNDEDVRDCMGWIEVGRDIYLTSVLAGSLISCRPVVHAALQSTATLEPWLAY
jgi:hypothetical protein